MTQIIIHVRFMSTARPGHIARVTFIDDESNYEAWLEEQVAAYAKRARIDPIDVEVFEKRVGADG